MGAYHTGLAKYVARCRDGEVRIQRALKLANVDLGYGKFCHAVWTSYMWFTSANVAHLINVIAKANLTVLVVGTICHISSPCITYLCHKIVNYITNITFTFHSVFFSRRMLGYDLNVMASPSLFLHFFRQLVFPCSYLIMDTIPRSLLVVVENIFTPLFVLPSYICTPIFGLAYLQENKVLQWWGCTYVVVNFVVQY